MRRGVRGLQRFQCKECRKYFTAERSPAKVLVFDIETLPLVMYAWRLGDETYDPDFLIKDWCILSYSYKWLFEPESYSDVLTPKEALTRNDKRLVKAIWDLFNEADIIIAHNGDKFDMPRMMTRFLLYDLLPPAPFQTIDTRMEAKRKFNFTSNKLVYLARFLGLTPKIHTELQLWIDCDNGKQEALDEMRRYNEGDIYTLEDVYVRLRPYIKHPNMGLFMLLDKGQAVCPHCAGGELDWDYYHRTPARVYRAARCKRCGAIGREFKSFVTTTVARVRV